MLLPLLIIVLATFLVVIVIVSDLVRLLSVLSLPPKFILPKITCEFPVSTTEELLTLISTAFAKTSTFPSIAFTLFTLPASILSSSAFNAILLVELVDIAVPLLFVILIIPASIFKIPVEVPLVLPARIAL